MTEIRKQIGLAGPLVLVSFLQYSLQLISIMFIGHLGELQLSGASMAFSFAGVTGFSLLVCCCLSSFHLPFLYCQPLPIVFFSTPLHFRFELTYGNPMFNQYSHNQQNFVSLFHIFVARNGQCIRDTMWTSLWSKTISHAWDPHAKSHGSHFNYLHSHSPFVGINPTNLHPSQTRPTHFRASWNLWQVANPQHHPLWPSSVPT